MLVKFFKCIMIRNNRFNFHSSKSSFDLFPKEKLIGYEKLFFLTNKILFTKDHYYGNLTLENTFIKFIDEIKEEKARKREKFKKIALQQDNDIHKIIEKKNFYKYIFNSENSIDNSIILLNDDNITRLLLIRNFIKLFHLNKISLSSISQKYDFTDIFNLFELNFWIFSIFHLNFLSEYKFIDNLVELMSITKSEYECLQQKISYNSFSFLIIENQYFLSDPKKFKNQICLIYYKKFFSLILNEEKESLLLMQDDDTTIQIMQILYSLPTNAIIDSRLINFIKIIELEKLEQGKELPRIEISIKKLKFYSKFLIDLDPKFLIHFESIISSIQETTNIYSAKLLLSCIINLGKSKIKSIKSIRIISKLLTSTFEEEYKNQDQIQKYNSNEKIIKDFYIEDYSHYFSNAQFFSNFKIDYIIELIQCLGAMDLKDYDLLKMCENLIIDNMNFIESFKHMQIILIIYLDFNVGSDIFYYLLLNRFIEMLNKEKDINEVL